ncbi:protein hairy-like isoform X2 [Narcine bancroftii]|uniref:protein hairy-like isoform X2 n=1 Tax=Narcine bancroftii TaxID=1343680 RepID=UPI00383147A7
MKMETESSDLKEVKKVTRMNGAAAVGLIEALGVASRAKGHVISIHVAGKASEAAAADAPAPELGSGEPAPRAGRRTPRAPLPRPMPSEVRDDFRRAERGKKPLSCISLQLLKPLVEKRRRDRMNRSLDQLKSFLLKHSRSESFRNGKMEKAEILEMTVQYLKNASAPDVQEHCTGIPQLNFQAGFQECLLQVNNFVRSCASVNAQSKSSLVQRLADFVDRSRADSQCRDRAGAPSRQSQPGHSAALGLLGASSHLHPQQGSHLLASPSVPLQQTQNPVDIPAESHERTLASRSKAPNCLNTPGVV